MQMGISYSFYVCLIFISQEKLKEGYWDVQSSKDRQNIHMQEETTEKTTETNVEF